MSFQQGLSGLNATSKSLDVIGNNIANSGTYGAKASRAEFADMYAAALNGAGTNNIGIGTTVADVAQQFTQGNITTTDNPMDMALNGAGFFQLSDGVNPPSYSRNGQFKVDRDGFIVSGDGKKLMGYAANAAGVIQPGVAVPLQLPTGGVTPSPTSKIAMEMNLDARKPVTTPAAPPLINFSDASTYNNATSMTVYDAKGQDIALTYYFQKTAADTWDVFATANGTTLGGVAAAPTPVTTLTFNADGTFAGSTSNSLAIPATTNAQGATTLPIPAVAFDLSQATEYGSAFGITNATQDGYTAGQLVAVSVDANGIVNAKYSNNQSRPAGQVEIATFRNPQGLQPIGNNSWASTYASGDPVKGAPGTGNLGVLQSGALEESGVDLTGELVNMITAQRAYQANAQTIKTQDQVMQTVVNLR